MEYLNRTVWATVGRSDIAGVGVIAIRDIPQGTKITDHNIFEPADRVMYEVTVNEFKTLDPGIQRIILDKTCYQKGLEKIVFLSPNQNACIQSFTNHSREPNSENGIAMRDIKVGEEVTQDYRKFFEDGFHELSEDHFGSFL